MIVTLSELSAFIKTSEAVPADRKRYLSSALNRARALLGDGHADVRADPKTCSASSTSCRRRWPG